MIRIGIAGYGNLGKGVEAAVRNNPDMQISAFFTRRAAASLDTRTPDVPIVPLEKALEMKDQIDVLIICAGSATDLPTMTPTLAENFNVVDSFDTHANIPRHFENTHNAALKGGKLALISCGWDPGLFSVMRVYGNAVLPNGSDYTFWGRGVSQGHSDAIRRIEGVIDARQYTVPVSEALSMVRSGDCPDLTTRQKHTRECFVVADPGADKKAIEHAIITMPNYFADYDTTVTFVSAEELAKNHSGLPHGGSVIRNGVTGINGENTHTVEFGLRLDSNPEFTGSVLTAYARAIYRMSLNGTTGCVTPLDIAPALLSPLSAEELRKKYL